MICIFVSPGQIKKGQAFIDGDTARHLSLVLRVESGERIFILDGEGNRYESVIEGVHKKGIRARILRRVSHSAESPLYITLVQGIPKGNKMDFIVQKTTELGVSKIVPLITERSQVRHTHRIERWRKIATSASQQSGRERVPEITEPVTFREFLERDDKSPLRLILSEDMEGASLKDAFNNQRDQEAITLLVGPEGGFSRQEVSLASGRGYLKISLGPRILRTETAPITAISIIQYEIGDMGVS